MNHRKIRDIRKVIKEIERVLKPGGLIFITVRKQLSKKILAKRKIIWDKIRCLKNLHNFRRSRERNDLLQIQ